MQTDIVERLTEMVANVGRDWRSGEEFLRSGHQSVVDGIREAAETIATLRREVEQARAKALEEAAVKADQAFSTFAGKRDDAADRGDETSTVIYGAVAGGAQGLAKVIRSLADKEG